jgi:hypothetical protein
MDADADAHACGWWSAGNQDAKVQQCRHRASTTLTLHWAKEDNILPSREKKGEKVGRFKSSSLKTGEKAVLNRME